MPGGEAGLEVILDERAAVDLVLADAAVVADPAARGSRRRGSRRAAVLQQREFLLDAEHRLVLLVLLGRAGSGGAGVGRVRLAVDEHHLAHHEHVVAATDRVRVTTTGLSTQSLLSPVAWLVLEPSKPQMGSSVAVVAGSWSSSGDAWSAPFRRSRCIQPCKPQLSSIPSVCSGCVRGYRQPNLDVRCRSRPMAGGIVAASGCRVVAPL